MAEALARAPFTVGKKELYLPTFSLALLRTPQLPPTHAKFLVPLWFSKLDLRDYLYHAYSVRTHNITVYVKQSRARYGPAEPQTPLFRKWHRPRAKKYMTVQLEQAFVWPEEVAEGKLDEEWDRGVNREREEDEEMEKERRGQVGDTVVNEQRRRRMREQARELLEGRQRWKPMAKRTLGQMLTR